MAKMTLLWILIFGGMFLIVEWFMIARGTASALVQILHISIPNNVLCFIYNGLLSIGRPLCFAHNLDDQGSWKCKTP